MASVSQPKNSPIAVTIDDKPLRNLARRFPRKAPAMISRAVNKTAKSTRAEMSKRLRAQVVNIKKGDLDKRNLLLRRGTRSAPNATITITGSRIPLIYFKGTTESRKGVGYKIRPGGARKRIADAFITTVNAGNSGASKKGVFVRRGKERLPITQLFGPSVPKALEDDKAVFSGVIKFANNRLEIEAASQVQYELSKS